MQRMMTSVQTRLFAWIIPSFLLGTGTPLWADDLRQKSGPDAVSDDSESNLDLELSSADRIANHTSLQWGLAYRRGPGIELGLDLYRDEDNLFTMKLGRFEAKNWEGFTQFDVTHVLVENTFFLGESLFVGIGASVASLRGVDKEKQLVTADGPKDFLFDATTQQVAFSMSAGNQWQFDHWTFGAHWLNLYLPFYVTSVKKTSPDVDATSYVRELQRKQDLSSTSWRIDYGVSLDLGYNF